MFGLLAAKDIINLNLRQMTATKIFQHHERTAYDILFNEWLRKETISKLEWSEGEYFTYCKLRSDSKAEIDFFDKLSISK